MVAYHTLIRTNIMLTKQAPLLGRQVCSWKSHSVLLLFKALIAALVQKNKTIINNRLQELQGKSQKSLPTTHRYIERDRSGKKNL